MSNYDDNDPKIVIDESEIERLKQKYNVHPIKPVPDIKNYKSLSIEEMSLIEPAPIDYIFYPCLPTQGIGWIYASTGMGKTMFTLNLAYAIASGGQFLTYTCPKPRKVLYVDGEMAFNQLHSRVMTIKQHQGDMDYPDNLHFITPDKLHPFRVPKIDEDDGQFIYEKKLIDEKFDVIVFDNISVLSSWDELKGNEWRRIGDWQLKLRSMGKSIINVHHSGKDKLGYRGASTMMDTADFAISLQPINEDGLEEEMVSAKKLKVKYSKNRNFSGKEALPFEVTFMNGIWTCQSMEKSEMQMVVEMIGLKMTQIAIAKEMGCGQSKIAKLVKNARKLGLIRD